MILLRTKLFGFYDESGKLLEKYTKGPAKKRYEKWRNEIISDLQRSKRALGFNDVVFDEQYLREQSKARDRQANNIISNRKTDAYKALNKNVLNKKIALQKAYEKAAEAIKNGKSSKAITYGPEAELQIALDDRMRGAMGNDVYRKRGKIGGEEWGETNQYIKHREYIDPEVRLDFVAKDSDIYHQLKKENRGLHKENSERLSNLEESEKEKEKLERDMKNLTDENESLTSKINSLKQEKEDAENKTSKLVGNIATLNNDKNSLIAKLSDKDNEINGLKDINSDLEKSNRNWKIGTAITGAGGIGLGFGIAKNNNQKNKENKNN
jgi:hypothetical protein